MQKQTRSPKLLRAFILILSLALASCNMPSSTAAPTSAVSSTPLPALSSTPAVLPTGLTFTPIAMTDTPLATDATATLTPGPDCDRVKYVSDLTYPDNENVKANEVITKTWQIRNVGTCAWDTNYKLVFVRGEQMNGASPAEVLTNPVPVGSTADISIELTVPDMNGLHWGVWQVVNGAGVPLKKADGTNQELSILINVTNGKGGRVTAVRTVSYFYAGVKCTNNVEYDMTMNIIADGPVSVGYTWVVSSGVLTISSQTVVFEAAGSKEVTTHINPPFADPSNVRVTLTANGVSSTYTICP